MRESNIYSKIKRDWPDVIQRVEGHPEGLPDFVFALDGRIGWLEIKNEVWRVRPAQAIFLRRWSFASWIVIREGAWHHLIPGGAVSMDCSFSPKDSVFSAVGAAWVKETALFIQNRG